MVKLHTPPIGPGTRVTLNFSLRLESGEIVDDTNNVAATFEVGDGNLLPGFERAMYGMRAGEIKDIFIDPERGFGLPNEENIHMMKRADFAKEMPLEEGLIVSFADQQGDELPGVITRFLGELVEVDFNHPLAGKPLIFIVDILEVEQISSEILRV